MCQQIISAAVNIFCRYDMITCLCKVFNRVCNGCCTGTDCKALPRRPLMLQYAVQKYPLSDWSVFRKYFLRHANRNGLLHALNCGIRRKMSGKSELLLHRSPDPVLPVQRNCNVSNFNFLFNVLMCFPILFLFFHSFCLPAFLRFCCWKYHIKSIEKVLIHKTMS